MSFAVSIDSLLRAETREDAAHREDGLCVVGVFGKSNMQSAAAKESLINTLTDKHVFSLFSQTDDGGAPESHIQAFYSQESRVLYLLLSSVCDSRQLLRACRSLSSGMVHSEAHDFWKGLERQHCLHLLYMFSVCHILLLVHPNQTFDVSYDRLFRALDALRQKVLPLLRTAIKDCPVSKEWKVNCRPCPPRLLFVFHTNGSLKVCGNGSDSAGNPDKPKKHSPRRRLQHALEDQIYHVFRKSRVLTNQSSNCLFTVPANQAFVYVIPGADQDPVGVLLGQLRSNCTLLEQDSAPPVYGPRRYQQMRRSARQVSFSGDSGGALMGSQQLDCSLKEFFLQHVDLVLTKKGFDDSVGRNPQPAHFELPSYSKWVQVASRLHQVLISKTEEEEEDEDEELAELATKVQAQLKVLEGFLDADTKFSENRCQRALPLAHSAYQSNLPHNYTTTVHKNQLAQALRVYSQHARGWPSSATPCSCTRTATSSGAAATSCARSGPDRPTLRPQVPPAASAGVCSPSSPAGLCSNWVRPTSYNCHAGLDQPSFLPGSCFLLPWDVVIRSRSEEEAGLTDALDGGASSWPAPNKTLMGKRGSTGGLGRNRRRDDMARVFVGFEYEDGRGRRFISAGPDKIVKVLGPGGTKDPATRVLNADMPLYIPSPSQGRGLKPHFAQLIRLFVVVPDAPLEVTLNPQVSAPPSQKQKPVLHSKCECVCFQVQPGPPPCPLFHPEQTEIPLPPDGFWVLRFPYSYATDHGPCYPPKENQPLNNYKVLRGILRATTA
ncbi:unnamed protein product, partial [Tetraodon nigroviridis]